MKKVLIIISLLIVFNNIYINAQNSWKHLTKDDGLASTWVNDCLEDKQGSMWFATDKGLCKFDGEKVESFTKKTGLPLDRIMDLFIDKNGIIWFTIEPANNASDIFGGMGGATGVMLEALSKRGNGWGRYDGTNINAFLNKKSAEYLMSQMGNVNGEIWIGGINRKNKKGYFLVNYDGQTFDPLTQLGGVDFSSVNYFYAKGRDDIWFSSWAENENFIYNFDGSNIIAYGEKDGLPSKANCKFINTILKDSNGRLWFGASLEGKFGSLMRFDGTNWTTYTKDYGVIGKSINQIVEDKDKNIWVGTNKGVNVFDGSKWTYYSQKNKLPGNIISVIFADSKGRVWIGTEKGLALCDNGRWSMINKKNGLTHNFVRSIFEDSKGNIWIGAASTWKWGGISLYDGNKCKPFAFRDVYANKFFEDSKGNIWVLSFGNGVLKKEGGF